MKEFFKRVGLLDSLEDAFCNGFLIASLMWVAVGTWVTFILIIPMLNNCIWIRP